MQKNNINVHIDDGKIVGLGIDAPKCISETFTMVWELAFNWIQKPHYKMKRNFETFKNEVDNEINQIPETNLIEPKMHIIGPVLETSKYYLEEKELRNMFAKLLASSVDDRKSKTVHPAFIEIIRQMSVNDAQNIIYLSKGFNGKDQFPIINYKKEKKEVGKMTIVANVLINQIKDNDISLDSVDACSTSLVNLERLGLIYIKYGIYISDFDYEVFSNLISFNNTKNANNELDITYYTQKGLIELTPLGHDFVKVCL